MSNPTGVIYKFTNEIFTLDDEVYNVVLTPELYSEGNDGLDFSGTFQGILIDPNRGSIPFEMSPSLEDEPKGEWEARAYHPALATLQQQERGPATSLFSPQIMRELKRIIRKMHPNT